MIANALVLSDLHLGWTVCNASHRTLLDHLPEAAGDAPVIERERADVLVHGHFHFGPGCSTIANRPAWRSGAWVARGHLGTVDRMLRYRAGTWERIGIEGGRVRVFDDGR